MNRQTEKTYLKLYIFVKTEFIKRYFGDVVNHSGLYAIFVKQIMVEQRPLTADFLFGATQ